MFDSVVPCHRLARKKRFKRFSLKRTSPFLFASSALSFPTTTPAEVFIFFHPRRQHAFKFFSFFGFSNGKSPLSLTVFPQPSKARSNAYSFYSVTNREWSRAFTSTCLGFSCPVSGVQFFFQNSTPSFLSYPLLYSYFGYSFSGKAFSYYLTTYYSSSILPLLPISIFSFLLFSHLKKEFFLSFFLFSIFRLPVTLVTFKLASGRTY